MILDDPGRDKRLLFLAATAKDAETTAAVLSPLGIHLDVCRTFKELLSGVGVRTGAVLLPEEVVSPEHIAALREVLAAQPPWSDLPVLILTRQGADSAESGEAVRSLGNVTLLERPVRVSTLISVVRTALRARERQYQIREHLARHVRSEAALKQADRRKDEFLATLGHELRNPLAPLLSAVQLLKRSSVYDPIAERVTPVMERQIRHLVRLVDDLLEVSRITRGLIEVQREPIDIAFVLQSAIETCRPMIDTAGHTLDIALPEHPLIVLGDTVRLTQVFSNLITNAAKYTNPGGHIWIAMRQEQGRVIVSVRDDGLGIAEDQLDSVFEMFTQVNRSSRPEQGGLGIGLTLVRSLVAMHGGTVTAHSRGPGSGSEFIVDLPAEAQTSLMHHELAPVPNFPRRRIMVVDDNGDAADTLGALLGALGAVVSVAHSGPAALEALPVFDPDAVLLDLGMPDMDGYEVARRIRATQAHRDLLLVALSGWGQEEDYRRSRAAGFNHHIVKPPDVMKLRELLLAKQKLS